MQSSSAFEPTLAAAHQRLAAVRPADYARTRNHLDGAVTGLSPYITHGLLSLREVLQAVLARGPLPLQHRLVAELGWREWFRHAWAHRGDGILEPWHPGPLPESAYTREMPADVAAGCTGVPAIDRAVAQLHAIGHLHNHARLWLASYLVHGRKLHWRTGADWLLGRLIDGDLASNHLSWQWVAGTASAKPYLFNAENVARFAPAAWHSPGTPLDTSYAALEAHARAPRAWPAGPGVGAGGIQDVVDGAHPPPTSADPPAWLGATAPDTTAVACREVWLVHPFHLADLPPDLPPDTVVIAVLIADWHQRWPWVAARWAFVGRRLQALTPRCWHADADTLARALAGARRVRTIGNPHLDPWLRRWAEVAPPPMLFPPVARPCGSFSQWWTRATRGLRWAEELLA
ncbi:MAG: deoxyribodipyrimidine photolyase [Burkholderiaceae bacterium]|nr:deoxyribodipyrimidine photolyase [Burkholderiaceae bacterium]